MNLSYLCSDFIPFVFHHDCLFSFIPLLFHPILFLIKLYPILVSTSIQIQYLVKPGSNHKIFISIFQNKIFDKYFFVLISHYIILVIYFKYWSIIFVFDISLTREWFLSLFLLFLAGNVIFTISSKLSVFVPLETFQI